MQATVLIVDDEMRLAMHLETILRRKGYEVYTAATGKEARAQMQRWYPDVALLDLRLPDANGTSLLTEFKKDFPETRFIMMTAYGSIESAVRSTQNGAVDYLTKPFDPQELLIIIHKAIKNKILSEELRRLRSWGAISGLSRQSPRFHYPSPAMRRVFSLVERAASRDGIVLLLGESGTGKDYLARWIHRLSSRAEGPFFSINCAAVSKELAESELFGHEPGAFTGTRGRKRGMLELADGGTILLNEIGEMDLQLQSKLLSFLDTKSFLRVGGEHRITIDTRILAATNRDLNVEVEQNRFRRDLFYRLNVMPIELPPLRERKEDIPVLVRELTSQLVSELGNESDIDVTPQVLDAYARYNWPGNIRELRNTLERAVIMSQDGKICETHFSSTGVGTTWRYEVTFPDKGQTLHEVTQQVSREIICEALRRAKTKSAAARLLGISRDALNYQIKTLNL